MVHNGNKLYLCDDCSLSDYLDQYAISHQREENFSLNQCWCDKTGGKMYAFGTCGEEYLECQPIQEKLKRRHGRAYRRRMTRKKEKRRRWLIRECSSTGGYIAWGWIDGNYVEVGTHVQFSKNSNAKRYWKRQSNKKIRRYKENIPHGCHYKKLFPYLWKIYF